MKRLHAFLRYLRIEDENGQLSLTTIAFGVGIYCLVHGAPVPLGDLSAFGLALGAYAHKRHRQAKVAELVAEGANEAAIARQQQQHELAKDAQGEKVQAIGDRVEQLIAKVQEIATPERLGALKEAFGRKAG